jgi:hypothetical protein
MLYLFILLSSGKWLISIYLTKCVEWFAPPAKYQIITHDSFLKSIIYYFSSRVEKQKPGPLQPMPWIADFVILLFSHNISMCIVIEGRYVQFR